jgi:hypothetical protein
MMIILMVMMMMMIMIFSYNEGVKKSNLYTINADQPIRHK